MYDYLHDHGSRSRPPVPAAAERQGAAVGSAAALIALQRSAGNRAVIEVIQRASTVPVAQRTVGKAPDEQRLAHKLMGAYEQVLGTTRRIMERRNSGQSDFMPPLDIAAPMKDVVFEINQRDADFAQSVLEHYKLSSRFGSIYEQILSQIPFVFQRDLLDVVESIQGRPAPGDYPEPSADTSPA